MQAHRYGAMLDMVGSGRLHPDLLVSTTIDLAGAAAALMDMDSFRTVGMTVITI
jgi:alcohol dehydrogenase